MLDSGASELEKEPSIVAITDIEFENSPSRISFLKDYPETRISDRVIGPYRTNQEIELPMWISQHLVDMGYAKFREEDQMSSHVISITQYKENLVGSRQLTKLPRTFYFHLRRFIRNLKTLETKDRSKGKELDKSLPLAQEIVNIRVRKIASLAASGGQSTELASNLTPEEQALYDRVHEVVELWKKEILGRDLPN